MWIWAVIIVSGICTFSSFYMAFLGARIGDRGAFLFAGFGLFFGIFLVISSIKACSKRSAFVKRIDDKLSGESKPVLFVPHWFIMTALILCGIGVLGAIFIPMLFK